MIYLDNAATTLHKPEPVPQAVFDCMSQGLGNSGRGVHADSLKSSSLVFDCREKLAKLFHTSNPAQVVFAYNATEALNIAIMGSINLGDHVISTDLEHNSVLRPLYRLQKEQNVALDFIPADKQGFLDYDLLPKLIRKESKALIVNHASNVTGNVSNLKLFGKFAKEHDLLFIVDASQTAGSFDINMPELGIDVLCFTGHKGLYGPMGTGGLVVREGLELRPLKVGGSGVQSYNPEQPQEMPTHLEAGTLNAHGICGLNAALSWIEELGVEHIHEREMVLMRKFYEALCDKEEFIIYGDFTQQERAPIVSLNLRDSDSAALSDYLAEHYNIATRPGAHCAPRMHKALGTTDCGCTRFSFGYFNTPEEVDQAIAALYEISAQ